VTTSAIRRAAVVAGIAAVGAALPSAAGAATINVHPGPSAIQKAINKADGGDTLRIHRGTYPETPVVNKRLTLRGVDGRPVINGRCDAQSTIEANANGVTLKRLSVKGGDLYGANYDFVDAGRVENVVFRETCDGALYGINVFQTGHMKLLDNDGKGFTDAGIYVGSLQDLGGKPFVIRGNDMHGNNIGILVEFGVDGLDVRVVDNRTSGNDLAGQSVPSGIMLRDNNDVLLEGNVANNNGEVGINLVTHSGGQSDNNTLIDNAAEDNGEFDLFNEGSGNCGAGNVFGTVSGALDPC
jgi:parallel beta-helix repeat protein